MKNVKFRVIQRKDDPRFISAVHFRGSNPRQNPNSAVRREIPRANCGHY